MILYSTSAKLMNHSTGRDGRIICYTHTTSTMDHAWTTDHSTREPMQHSRPIQYRVAAWSCASSSFLESPAPTEVLAVEARVFCTCADAC